MNLHFGYIGWNQDNGSDKIWGWCEGIPVDMGNNMRVHIFWGRRGKALQFKTSMFNSDLLRIAAQKENKGYDRISRDELLRIWPDFDEMCQQKLTWHLMKSD